MTERDLQTVAREWWGSDGTSRAFDEVWQIQEYDHGRLPALFRALADTVPAGESLAYVGIAIVESLLSEPDPVPSGDILGWLRSAGLAADEIGVLLGGMYPHFRSQFPDAL